MKKLAAVALLALGIGSTGCVTAVTQDVIHQQIHDDGGRMIAEVATFPVTATADVALLPAYVIATPILLAAIGNPNLNFMAH